MSGRKEMKHYREETKQEAVRMVLEEQANVCSRGDQT
jgi:transposase-like protein